MTTFEFTPFSTHKLNLVLTGPKLGFSTMLFDLKYLFVIILSEVPDLVYICNLLLAYSTLPL